MYGEFGGGGEGGAEAPFTAKNEPLFRRKTPLGVAPQPSKINIKDPSSPPKSAPDPFPASTLPPPPPLFPPFSSDFREIPPPL